MQAVFDASVRRLPQLHLQKLIAKRLSAMGVELKASEIEDLAKHLLAGKTSPFELEERPGLMSATLTFTEEDNAEIAGLADRITLEMPRVIEGFTRNAVEVLLRRIRKEWPRIQAEHEENRAAFNETIQLIWGDALDKLDMLSAASDSVGGHAIAVARSSRSKKRAALIMALDRLHVRGIQVATEVVVLLREGFADAALSRWRTLHEISVVAMMLGDHGEDLAIRYLDHDVVETQRAAETFQRCHPKDAAKRENVAKLRQTKAEYDAVVEHYGQAFRSPYGWAAKHLGKEKPTFQHLEDAADQAQMRLQYKVASYGVHAGTKGLTSSIADIFGEGPPGAASIAGLHEAGIETAYSLVRLTGPLLGLKWSVDQLAGLTALIKLRDCAAKAFSQGGRAMSEATWVSEEEIEAWQQESDYSQDG
ncbi:DUF5677 domain-containing protein [Agrobacterium tumefaciens]|uniref:DUF5677 domain-containing protein n=1 Tax=Agrobacterium tumefaciens TaxID=358 RepID=UPI002340067A|nr:DUF5677 domain-containing protein [Agrobacterium tumefaciens]WCJ62730.1 DUF5677 domain-containing protein [Agrobacterium tumefaciens]